jgi:signal transduction histidine kinase
MRLARMPHTSMAKVGSSTAVRTVELGSALKVVGFRGPKVHSAGRTNVSDVAARPPDHASSSGLLLHALDAILRASAEQGPSWLTLIARHLAKACDARLVLFVRTDADCTVLSAVSGHGLPRRAMADASIEALSAALTTELAPPDYIRGARVARCASTVSELARHHALTALPMSVNGRVVCVCLIGWRVPARDSTAAPAIVRPLVRQIAAAIESRELQQRLIAAHLELERQGQASQAALERAYGDLHHAREELRTLAAHVERVRERERSRISRELHDELGQALTSLKMDLGRLGRRRGAERDGAVRELASAIDGMVDNVRRIANELRPHLLDNLGLVAALEAQTQDFVRRTGVPCRFRCRGTPSRLDGERATALFRIFQEVLTNVARHAEATQVQIMLTIGATVARLEVDDNGRGMSSAGSDERLGLLGMRERAEAFGGRVAISPASPRGTRVRVRIPLPDTQEAS